MHIGSLVHPFWNSYQAHIRKYFFRNSQTLNNCLKCYKVCSLSLSLSFLIWVRTLLPHIPGHINNSVAERGWIISLTGSSCQFKMFCSHSAENLEGSLNSQRSHACSVYVWQISVGCSTSNPKCYLTFSKHKKECRLASTYFRQECHLPQRRMPSSSTCHFNS